jgi:hypothetical protein
VRFPANQPLPSLYEAEINRMPNFRRGAAVVLLALAAGCIVPTGPATSIAADIRVTTRGTGADSTHVQADFIPLDGDRIDFRSDTLRVQNVTGTRAGSRQTAFFASVPLDSAAVAGGLRVRLPGPKLGPVPHSEFTLYSVARRGSPSVTLRVGQDLLLPISPGSSGTLGAPEFEHWSVGFTRGGAGLTISGTGPLSTAIVIPWALIPKEGPNTLQVRLYSTRSFRVDATSVTGPRLLTNISAEANLEWSVQIIP